MRASLLAIPLAILPFLLQEPANERTLDIAFPGTLSVDEIRERLAAPGAHDPFVPVAPLGIGEDLAQGWDPQHPGHLPG